ncbi:putative ubiquinone biosynthesis protein COQ7 [Magnetospirillum sp. LM-5]|uniref:demethoxyubiquinone hydroxylase family protein n=1 Tax=Magnetospirillum sp. LM-5 TaxID=2681466 RepID=UPI00137EC4E9|nr:demethoxyubiquinone hydroxylase family protein [Magnetospirillum sp. LM-5]CAA7619975.1 putative ubiquinone biosynthesis protein COQ7 [Magnetospirillum sp. LM-5]
MKTAERRIPGDPTKDQLIDRFLRVNQAGELGAVRIYQGQRAVLGKGRHGPLLAHMAAQEQHHLDTFNRLIGERRTRPTVLAPLWHVAGFVLGAGTALLGERAAMACTVAVEETIDAHYAEQAAQLGDDEAPLKATIEQFRAEELEHRDIGLANEAEQAPGYPVLSTAIKTGCRIAIWLSERI